MKIYISGRITGNKNWKEQFQSAEDFLLKLGFEKNEICTSWSSFNENAKYFWRWGKMKQYRCLKTFYVAILDDEGFPTEKNMRVKKDSIWYEAPSPILGGEIRLESDNDDSFLEISEEYLKCYFEYIDEVEE